MYLNNLISYNLFYNFFHVSNDNNFEIICEQKESFFGKSIEIINQVSSLIIPIGLLGLAGFLAYKWYFYYGSNSDSDSSSKKVNFSENIETIEKPKEENESICEKISSPFSEIDETTSFTAKEYLCKIKECLNAEPFEDIDDENYMDTLESANSSTMKNAMLIRQQDLLNPNSKIRTFYIKKLKEYCDHYIDYRKQNKYDNFVDPRSDLLNYDYLQILDSDYLENFLSIIVSYYPNCTLPYLLFALRMALAFNCRPIVALIICKNNIKMEEMDSD
jgi:hypothetical protein